MDTLIAHIRAHSREMLPIPTELQASTRKLKGLKAVIFDIYGTLFISGSGDISLARMDDRGPALREALVVAGFRVNEARPPKVADLHKAIQQHRQLRQAQGISYPEIRIEEVWEEWLTAAKTEEQISGEGDLQTAIVAYECKVNPCWPMPGLAALLDSLQASRVPLGIVSNAQFYTPLLFPALLDSPFEALPFAGSLCRWSYLEREGKPSTGLFQRLAGDLAKRGLAPEEALFLGNDMLNDIYPARQTGLRTALFAGDKRSLRLRKEDPRCRDLTPDAILTDLSQLPALLEA
jgi:putative hydrolase of the HAD superfamily